MTVVSFVCGGVTSMASSGYIGMMVAVYANANARTTVSARSTNRERRWDRRLFSNVSQPAA
jgi:Na+/H+-translocating membrane pyrophosphatase